MIYVSAVVTVLCIICSLGLALAHLVNFTHPPQQKQ